MSMKKVIFGLRLMGVLGGDGGVRGCEGVGDGGGYIVKVGDRGGEFEMKVREGGKVKL